jgi:hypothetical protein
MQFAYRRRCCGNVFKICDGKTAETLLHRARFLTTSPTSSWCANGAYLGRGSAVVFKKLRAILLIVVPVLLMAGLVQADVTTSGGATVPTLKDQLKTGLLARTPDENAFVDEVVQMVDDGDLPLSLVNSTFLWARRKQPYPMQYFIQALKARAKAQGITL